MRSSVKRAVLIAAIAGSVIAPSMAFADHKPAGNTSPGQTCVANAGEDPTVSGDEFSDGTNFYGSKGACASAVAKGNGHKA